MQLMVATDGGSILALSILHPSSRVPRFLHFVQKQHLVGEKIHIKAKWLKKKLRIELCLCRFGVNNPKSAFIREVGANHKQV